MELLISLSTKTGQFTSPFFTPRKHATLILEMPDHSVQDLRNSPHACGLTWPVLKWLDAVRLEDTVFVPDTWETQLQEFASRLINANTCGLIWDRGEACFEYTMVFSNLPVYSGGELYTLERLKSLTKNHTLSKAWSD